MSNASEFAAQALKLEKVAARLKRLARKCEQGPTLSDEADAAMTRALAYARDETSDILQELVDTDEDLSASMRKHGVPGAD